MTTLAEIFTDDAGPFLTWVKKQEEHDFVGYSNSSIACPLHTFAAEVTGERVKIRKWDVASMSGISLIALPRWAEDVVRVLDGGYESRITIGVLRYCLGMLGYSSSQFRRNA
jgi:hypothetical protein